MKAYSSASWGLGSTLVYLLDDRIEVGAVSTGFSEELRRLAYRDVQAVVCWRSRRPRFLVLGGLGLVSGVVVSLLGLTSGSVDSDAAVQLAAGALLALAGGMSLFHGRLGSALEFRIDGVRGSIRGVVVGRRARHGFLDELSRRIEERRLRVPG